MCWSGGIPISISYFYLTSILGSQILKKIDREDERLHPPPAVSAFYNISLHSLLLLCSVVDPDPKLLGSGIRNQAKLFLTPKTACTVRYRYLGTVPTVLYFVFVSAVPARHLPADAAVLGPHAHRQAHL